MRKIIRVADPDLGSGAFLTSGSGIWDGKNPDPVSGMNIPDLIMKRMRIRDPDLLTLDPEWKKIGSGMLNKHPGSSTMKKSVPKNLKYSTGTSNEPKKM
jgi:hypothetical protein